MKLSRQDRTVNLLLYLFIILFSLSVLYPFYYVAMNSFNALLDFGPVYLLPKQWSSFYYQLIFRDDKVSHAFMISVLRTLAGIVVNVASAAMAAFALRKPDLKFRNLYFTLATITLFFNGGLIPAYIVIKNLMLYDTFLIYIFPGMFNFLFIVILMSVFNDVPRELEDSAKVDGAGPFIAFARIFVPLSIPVIATISLFEGVTQWNAWFDTVYFTSSDKLATLSSILIRIVSDAQITEVLNRMSSLDTRSQRVNIQGIKFATMIVSIVPILMSYPFLQRYFVKGIKIGAIKG